MNLQGDSDNSQAIIDSMKIASMYKEASRKLLNGELTLDDVPLIDNIVASNFPDSRFPENREFW